MGSAPVVADIQRVLILGDNRLSDSIIHSLSRHKLELHHAVYATSDTHSHHTTVHPTDFSPDSLTALFQSTTPDLVFSTHSGNSFSFQKLIIDRAIDAKIPRFVPAEFGQDSLNEQIQAKLPPAKERAQVIEYLRQKSAEGSIEWVAAATGCTLDRALISGNLGFDLAWQSATIHGSGEERFAASSTAFHGKVAAAIVEYWESVKNQYVYIPGMITSANSVLQALREETGQQWERGEVEIEAIVREAEKRNERGWPDAAMFLIERAVLFDEEMAAVQPFLEEDGRAKLGLEAETLQGLVNNAVHEFRHHGKGDCGCG